MKDIHNDVYFLSYEVSYSNSYLSLGKAKADKIIAEVVDSLPFLSPTVKITRGFDNNRLIVHKSTSPLDMTKKQSIQWTEKTRLLLHRAASLRTGMVSRQHEYLSNRPQLNDEFKWQQSKADVESITNIVKTQINVKVKKERIVWSFELNLLADANCCKPIVDHIGKLVRVCIYQRLSPPVIAHGYIVRTLQDYERCYSVVNGRIGEFRFDRLKKHEWIKEFLELEEKLKNGYPHCFPFRSDLQANYEEPDSDHLLLLKLNEEFTNRVWIQYHSGDRDLLYKILLLRSLLVRHVRRYHKALDKKVTEYEKFLGSDEYIEMHQLKEECIEHGLLKYSNPKDTTTPMNKYIGANGGEWAEIMRVLRRCLNLLARKKAEQEAIRDRELEELSRKAKLVAMGVIVVDGEFGDLYIPLPADRTSNVYRKSEAACIVTAQSFKRTADRRTLIERIVDEQYVSSSSALYDVVQRFENGESILDDKWARGKQWKIECTGDKEFTKHNVDMPTSFVHVMDITRLIPKSYNNPTSTNNNNVHFKSGKRLASIILQATPFTFRHRQWRDKAMDSGPGGVTLYPDISNPSDIDIFDFIGNVPKDPWGNRYDDKFTKEEVLTEFHKAHKLYFSTTEFPPPTPPITPGELLTDGWSEEGRDLLGELGVVPTEQYKELREEQLHKASLPPECDASTLTKLTNYIKSKSIECGSPVVCTRSKSRGRIFQCQHCYRLPDHKCISFDVRWDKFGFYVHLLKSTHRERAVGNMFHHPDCIIPEEIAKRRFVDMETDTGTIDDQSECIDDIESDDSSFSAGTSSSFESEGSIEDTSTDMNDSCSLESYDSFNGDPYPCRSYPCR